MTGPLARNNKGLRILTSAQRRRRFFTPLSTKRPLIVEQLERRQVMAITISNVHLAHDSGLMPADLVTNDPTIAGNIASTSSYQTLSIEADLNADGIADAMASPDANGAFELRLPVSASGAVTARIRGAGSDPAGNAESSWTTFNFTLDPNANSLASISQYGLRYDTGGSTTDSQTSDTTVRGTVVNDGDMAYVVVDIDENQDGIADSFVVPSKTGEFSYSPMSLTPGVRTVSARVRERSATLASEQVGAWVSKTFTYDLAENQPASVSQFGLMYDTGSSASDKVTGNARIQGQVANDGMLDRVPVEIDLNNDGVADDRVYTTSDGKFAYSPSAVSAGSQTFRVRAVERNADLLDIPSAWQTLTFNFDAAADTAPSLTGVGLLNDDGSSTSDGITTDPRLVGQFANDGTTAAQVVEVDLNGDGVVDDSVKTGATGQFQYTPKALAPGQQTIRFRATEPIFGSSGTRTGAWQQKTFTVGAATNLLVSELGLASDTGVSSTDGITRNALLAGHVARTGLPTLGGAPVIGVSLSGLKVEFDRDGDGTPDGSTTSKADGSFELLPLGIQSGSNQVRVRVYETTRAEGYRRYSDWSTVNFVLEANQVPALGQFALKFDTGASNTDHITADPTLVGHVTDDVSAKGLAIEYDRNGDGIVDASVVTNDLGDFEYRDTGLSYGAQNVRVRVREKDAFTGVDLVTAWSSLSLDLVAPTLGSITSFVLQRDTGSADGVTQDAALQGTVTDVDSVANLKVDLDYDGNGTVDASTMPNSNGEFSLLPSGIIFGQASIKARLRESPAIGTTDLVGSWSTLSFQFNSSSLLSISSIAAVGGQYGVVDVPKISGTVETTTENRLQVEQIEIDLNNDGRGDAKLAMNSFGSFTYVATTLPAGYQTLRARSVAWDTQTGNYVTSNWATVSFTYDPKTPVVSEFKLAHDLGTSSTDNISWEYDLKGKITILRPGAVSVEIDQDGDGEPEATVDVTANGDFAYEPDELSPGEYTFRARAVQDTGTEIGKLTSAWATRSFTVIARPTPTVDSIALKNDTGSSATDKITWDPAITGTASRIGSAPILRVEMDRNGDDIADETLTTDIGGNFQLTPKDLIPGAQSLRFRAIEDLAEGGELTGAWTTFSFTLQAKPAPVVSNLQLVVDTGSSATDGVTWDTRIKGNVARDGAIVPYLLVEYDQNNDGTADGSIASNVNGEFVVSPSRLPYGASTIQLRGVELNGEEQSPGAWSSLSITRTEASVPRIDSLQANDAAFARIGGTASYLSEPSLIVQFDHNSDGVAEFTISTGADGEFSYTGKQLIAGSVTLKARAGHWDAFTSSYLFGDWSSLTFQYAPAAPTAISLVEFGLASDTGASSSDNISADPTIRGRIDGSLEYADVQIDKNNDGVADATLSPMADGRFEYTAEQLAQQQHTLRARYRQWNPISGAFSYGSWSNVTFTLNSSSNSTPSVTSFQLVQSTTGSNGLETSNATVKGEVGNDGAVSGLKLEFDYNADGIIDGNAVTGSDGKFVFLPVGLHSGANTLRVRAVETIYGQTPPVVGSWVSLSFTYNVNGNSPALVQSFALRNDTGSSQSDRITSDPTLKGKIVNDGLDANLLIEIDRNNDGIADYTTYSLPGGDFSITPMNLADGSHTVRARVIEWDQATSQNLTSSWSSLTFTLQASGNAAPSIATIGLANDTGTVGDNQTTDPTLTGSISNDGNVDQLIVEFDHNGDGLADGSATTNSQGAYSYTPFGIATGLRQIKARVKEQNPLTNEFIVGGWTQAQFTLLQNAAPVVASIQLKNDTGSSATDKVTTDPTLKGTLTNDGVLGKILVEFDYNTDGTPDGKAFTNGLGEYEFTPHGLSPGANSIRVRGKEWDPVTSAYVVGNWVAFTFTLESAPPIQPGDGYGIDGYRGNQNSAEAILRAAIAATAQSAGVGANGSINVGIGLWNAGVIGRSDAQESTSGHFQFLTSGASSASSSVTNQAFTINDIDANGGDITGVYALTRTVTVASGHFSVDFNFSITATYSRPISGTFGDGDDGSTTTGTENSTVSYALSYDASGDYATASGSLVWTGSHAASETIGIDYASTSNTTSGEYGDGAVTGQTTSQPAIDNTRTTSDAMSFSPAGSTTTGVSNVSWSTSTIIDVSDTEQSKEQRGDGQRSLSGTESGGASGSFTVTTTGSGQKSVAGTTTTFTGTESRTVSGTITESSTKSSTTGNPASPNSPYGGSSNLETTESRLSLTLSDTTTFTRSWPLQDPSAVTSTETTSFILTIDESISISSAVHGSETDSRTSSGATDSGYSSFHGNASASMSVTSAMAGQMVLTRSTTSGESVAYDYTTNNRIAMQASQQFGITGVQDRTDSSGSSHLGGAFSDTSSANILITSNGRVVGRDERFTFAGEGTLTYGDSGVSTLFGSDGGQNTTGEIQTNRTGSMSGTETFSASLAMTYDFVVTDRSSASIGTREASFNSQGTYNSTDGDSTSGTANEFSQTGTSSETSQTSTSSAVTDKGTFTVSGSTVTATGVLTSNTTKGVTWNGSSSRADNRVGVTGGTHAKNRSESGSGSQNQGQAYSVNYVVDGSSVSINGTFENTTAMTASSSTNEGATTSLKQGPEYAPYSQSAGQSGDSSSYSMSSNSVDQGIIHNNSLRTGTVTRTGNTTVTTRSQGADSQLVTLNSVNDNRSTNSANMSNSLIDEVETYTMMDGTITQSTNNFKNQTETRTQIATRNGNQSAIDGGTQNNSASSSVQAETNRRTTGTITKLNGVISETSTYTDRTLMSGNASASAFNPRYASTSSSSEGQLQATNSNHRFTTDDTETATVTRMGNSVSRVGTFTSNSTYGISSGQNSLRRGGSGAGVDSSTFIDAGGSATRGYDETQSEVGTFSESNGVLTRNFVATRAGTSQTQTTDRFAQVDSITTYSGKFGLPTTTQSNSNVGGGYAGTGGLESQFVGTEVIGGSSPGLTGTLTSRESNQGVIGNNRSFANPGANTRSYALQQGVNNLTDGTETTLTIGPGGQRSGTKKVTSNSYGGGGDFVGALETRSTTTNGVTQTFDKAMDSWTLNDGHSNSVIESVISGAVELITSLFEDEADGYDQYNYDWGYEYNGPDDYSTWTRETWAGGSDESNNKSEDGQSGQYTRKAENKNKDEYNEWGRRWFDAGMEASAALPFTWEGESSGGGGGEPGGPPGGPPSSQYAMVLGVFGIPANYTQKSESHSNVNRDEGNFYTNGGKTVTFGSFKDKIDNGSHTEMTANGEYWPTFKEQQIKKSGGTISIEAPDFEKSSYKLNQWGVYTGTPENVLGSYTETSENSMASQTKIEMEILYEGKQDDLPGMPAGDATTYYGRFIRSADLTKSKGQNLTESAWFLGKDVFGMSHTGTRSSSVIGTRYGWDWTQTKDAYGNISDPVSIEGRITYNVINTATAVTDPSGKSFHWNEIPQSGQPYTYWGNIAILAALDNDLFGEAYAAALAKNAPYVPESVLDGFTHGLKMGGVVLVDAFTPDFLVPIKEYKAQLWAGWEGTWTQYITESSAVVAREAAIAAATGGIASASAATPCITSTGKVLYAANVAAKGYDVYQGASSIADGAGKISNGDYWGAVDIGTGLLGVSELRGLGKLIAEGPKCFVGDTLVAMAEPFDVLTAAEDGFLTWALSDRRVIAGVSFVMLGAAGAIIFRKRKRRSGLALDMAIDEWNSRIEEEWLQSARPRRIADDDLLPADELFAQCDDLGETDDHFEDRFSHFSR